MRTQLMAAVSVVALVMAGCSGDRRAVTEAVPTEDDGTSRIVVADAPAYAGTPAPTPSDRVLFDTRGSLQQAATLAEALRLFGIEASSRKFWGFTTNMDGAGTNALRVDWKRWDGTNCRNVGATLPRTLPSPYPKTIYVTWKQRLGRTATGGGVGVLNDFQVHNWECGSAGRTVWQLFRANGDSSAIGRVDVTWPGPQPVEPSIKLNNPSVVLRPNLGLTYNPQDRLGEIIEQTVFVRAESSPGARDGEARLWVNGKLLVSRTGLAIGPDGFRRFVFPATYRAPMLDQSEYFWDIVAWQPDAITPPPSRRAASVTVTPGADTIVKGDTARLVAQARDSAGSVIPGVVFSWSTLDNAVASVNASGLVTALNSGTARIVAALDGVSDTSSILVPSTPPPTLVAIELTPSTVTLQAGATQQFTVTGRRSDGSTAPVTVTYAATGGTITTAGLYTAGSTAGSFRVIATQSGGSLADTSAVTITSPPPPPPGGKPNLGALPIANRQLPLFESYSARSLAANASYLDPVTGVRVWKMTSATVPVAQSAAQHDYSGGPVQISREWGTGQHTVLSFQAGSHYLADFRRGSGFSNWRDFPNTSMQLGFTFAQNPATPRIAYYTQGSTLRRYNVATGADEPSGFFPKSFSAQTGTVITWLQSDKNDEWFVMMPADQSKVIAWNSRTNQLLTRSISTLDEPHLEKDGRYVMMINAGSSANMYTWDLVTNTATGNSGRLGVHVDGVRRYFHAQDPDLSSGPQFYMDPATSQTVNTLTAHELSAYLQHRAGQWVQSDTELGGNLLKQWILWSGYEDGPVSTGGWSLHSGSIYSTPVSFIYEQAVSGVQSVRQFVAGDGSRVQRQLSKASSIAAMSDGSFYFDAAADRVYVWAQGGGSPAGRVSLRAPGKAHDAIAFVRLDGSETRLLAHHYSVNPGYDASPKATLSPDGKLVMFTSNMNDSDARNDVFVVEVPLQ